MSIIYKNRLLCYIEHHILIMQQSGYSITTFDYEDNSLKSGVEVNIENVIDGKCYNAEGVVIKVHDDNVKVRFNDKFRNERVELIKKENVFPKEMSPDVKHVSFFYEYNFIMIILNNNTAHLIDLNDPGTVKYKIDSLVTEKYRSVHMISSNKLLQFADDAREFGQGCIIDLTGETSTIFLKPSTETQEINELWKSGSPVHLINDNDLYLSNGLRVCVFDLLSGNEIRGWNISKERCAPSLSLLNGQVFTNNKKQIINLSEFSHIEIPLPERVIYCNEPIVESKFFTSPITNPDKQLFVTVYYPNDVNQNIFTHGELFDLIDVLLSSYHTDLSTTIIDKISEKISETKNKYPSLIVEFDEKQLSQLIHEADFKSIIDYGISREIRRYVCGEYRKEYFLQVKNKTYDFGLRFENDTLCKVQNGSLICDGYTQILFPNKKYDYVNTDMMIKFTLFQTLLNVSRDLSKIVKYKNINDLPLSFTESFTFDGTRFYRKECLDNVVLWNHTQDLEINGKKFDLNGNKLNDWGYYYPDNQIKSNYYIEKEVVPYHKAMSFKGIHGQGSNRKRPSEQGFLIYGITKFSERHNTEDQCVKFFVWRENYVDIKIPLCYYPQYGLVNTHGLWINNNYVTYSNNYVKIVKVQ